MKKILPFIVLIVLIVVFTPVFGGLFTSLTDSASSGFFWGLDTPGIIEGFFMSLMFFVSFVAMSNKNKKFLILLGLVLLFDVFLGVWDGLIVNIVTGLIGALFGFAVKYISNKKFSRSKSK
jgi:hypothetical protein